MAVAKSTPVRIVALGGLGEIGLNLMVIECAQSAIIIDAGVMFAEERELGVGLLLPDSLTWKRATSKSKGSS